MLMVLGVLPEKTVLTTEYTILYHAFSADNSGSRSEFNAYCMKNVKNCTREKLMEMWHDKLLMVNGWKDVRTTRKGTNRFYEL